MKHLLIGGLILCLCVIGLVIPVSAQSPLPTFVLDAQTTISVTVTLADGQVVVVPIDLLFVTRSELEGAYITLDATANPVANATVTVQESGHISAAMKALVYHATATPVAVVQPTIAPPTNTPLPPTVAPTLVVVAPTNTPMPQATSTSAPVTVDQERGPSYEAVCDADTNNMTDPQIAAYAEQYVGQRFSGWHGWVYDVVSLADGTYNLEIAMEERGLFWGRDIVIENIVSSLAMRLNVEQPVTFSGRIARVETTFEVMCNPLVIEDYVLIE